MDWTPQDIWVDEWPSTPRSLRVAVVTETYPPEVNGVATTIAKLVEGLRLRHHQVQLVRPKQSTDTLQPATPGAADVLMRGLPVPRYPHLKMGLPSKKALMSLWVRHRPDVVHIATEGPLGWSALQAARALKLPISSEFRTNFHEYSRHYGIGWLSKPIAAYLKKFHNRADCTMVPTEALRAQLEQLGFHRLRVVARGVDAQRFDPVKRNEALRRAWGLAPGQRAVLYVGRLAAEKNLGLLIQAFEAMQTQDPGLKLVIVGDGPLRRELGLRCPHALFAGERRGDDLAAHYASADLFVFPSTTETYGNVTPEAMASGLPVLAFEHAAAAQLIRSHHSGMLAPVDAPHTFIELGCKLAADPALAQQLGQRARMTAAQRDWGLIIEQVESTLLEIMERRLADQPRGAAVSHKVRLT